VFSFGTSLTICNGAALPAGINPLPTTSTNGITGTWSPSTVSNTASGVYTFTPDNPSQCGTPATFTVTVNPNITPVFSFGTSLTICNGAALPAGINPLPNTSTNGITGTWSPSAVSNTSSGVYTFTPDNPSQCGTTATFTVTVNPLVTPVFSFGTSLTICNGAALPAGINPLPNTSTNGITGTWSPSTVSNTSSGVYTFTPNNPAQCGTVTTFTVTVNPNITPVFSFGTSLTICNGAALPVGINPLPNTSTNGITGTWSPSTVSNTSSGVYTFTPDNPSQCGTTATFTVTVNPLVTPLFSFGTSLSICNGAALPAGINPLPTTSTNGITGTWSPSTVSNTSSGVYTFIPDNPSQCGTTATLTVTVNPILTPAFSFGTSLTICSGATAPSLLLTSINGINGTWSPSTINNTSNGVYTFTPNAGQCGTTTTLTVTVDPNIVPTFAFGTSLTICSGGTVPASLPTISVNGINGTWSPATVSNTSSGVYTFTPATGLCATVVTYTVTVNPIVTPTFSFASNQSICIGASVPPLPITSTNNITGTWSPATISNQASGSYTFTPTAGLCASAVTINVEVNPVPSINAIPDITVNDGTIVAATIITPSPANATISWVNSNPAIGLAASGNGNVPQFTAVNLGNTDITATVTVTPRINGCIGTPVSYRITVRALNKDVFVPNVFSPNNDGKNDKLLVYGNYITRLEMRIFNQYGQEIAFVSNGSQGWDGTHKGKPQPVGVYVYTLRAVMRDGRTVDLKGSITLVR
jgi:large repetitive protein